MQVQCSNCNKWSNIEAGTLVTCECGTSILSSNEVVNEPLSSIEPVDPVNAAQMLSEEFDNAKRMSQFESVWKERLYAKRIKFIAIGASFLLIGLATYLGCAHFSFERHWACGWFEIIIVQPGTKSEEIGNDIEARLEDYPYLDEDDVSNREYEEFLSGWSSYGVHDFRKAVRNSFEMSQKEKDALEALDDDNLREFYMDRASEPYTPESDGIYISAGRMVERMTDKDHKELIALASGKSLNENPNQLELAFE